MLDTAHTCRSKCRPCAYPGPVLSTSTSTKPDLASSCARPVPISEMFRRVRDEQWGRHPFHVAWILFCSIFPYLGCLHKLMRIAHPRLPCVIMMGSGAGKSDTTMQTVPYWFYISNSGNSQPNHWCKAHHFSSRCAAQRERHIQMILSAGRCAVCTTIYIVPFMGFRSRMHAIYIQIQSSIFNFNFRFSAAYRIYYV